MTAAHVRMEEPAYRKKTHTIANARRDSLDLDAKGRIKVSHDITFVGELPDVRFMAK